MAYTRSIDNDGFLITTLSGAPDFQEFCTIQEELDDYLLDGNVYELVLHTDDLQESMGSMGIRSSAINMNARKGPGKVTIAFVCTPNYLFGLCRQLVLQIHNDFTRAAVFRTEEEARVWLHSIRLSNALKRSAQVA